MFSPGSNQLNIAMRYMAPQTVQYYKYHSRVENSVGELQSFYNLPVSMRGSLQAVTRDLAQAHNLDWQADYVTFYTVNDLLDIKRDVSNDKIVYGARQFDVLSANDWYAIDRWKGVLCVAVTDNPIEIIP